MFCEKCRKKILKIIEKQRKLEKGLVEKHKGHLKSIAIGSLETLETLKNIILVDEEA